MAPIPTGARRWRGAAALVVLVAAHSRAADWTISTEIGLRETYTDNAFIGTTPRREDFVTEITPSLRIDGRSARLTASLHYRPSALVYARHSEGNDVVNNLDASARLEAVERFFFIDALGSVTQNFISPFAAQPADIATASPNRIETRTFSLSPHLRGELGRSLEYDLRHRNTWTTTNNDSLGDLRTAQWTGRVARPVQLFGWALEYEDTEIHREGALTRQDDQERLLRARLHFQPSESWRFSASAGREENNFVLGRTERETIGGAGVSWRPGPRTSADFEYEHRFFGPSRLARFSHRTPLSAWSLRYSRDTSTFQEELLRVPPGDTAALVDAIFAGRIADPAQRTAAVEQFLRSTGAPAFLSTSLAFFTQRVYLREGVDASFAILGARNTITFTAFRAENTPLAADAAAIVPDAFALVDRFTQRGFGAHADHKLTPFTTVGASASRTYTRQEQPSRVDSRNDAFTLTLNHTMSPKTRAYAGVSATRFDSDETGLVDQDATSVFVGLNHRF